LKEYSINDKNSGTKLFRFVKGVLPGLKNTEIFMLLRKKLIRVNNKKQEQNYLLVDGDKVQVRIGQEHIEKKEKQMKFRSIKKDFDIVFENKDIIAVNKYRGMLVHPDKNEYKDNLYEMIRSYLYSKGEYDPKDDFTPSPCHRLDKNTSGLMVFAKNHTALSSITKMLRERKAVKTYIALVAGMIDRPFLITSKIDVTGTIVKVDGLRRYYSMPAKELFLEKNPEISASLIKPLHYSDKYSIVEIELWTGKKHQIRAHMKYSGHPLLGDRKYFTKISEKLSEELRLGHYFLHSYKLKIEGYDEWTASIPGDLQNVIEKLF
jgi:23S rRNA pseudouridine955/2504/2580 synthase